MPGIGSLVQSIDMNKPPLIAFLTDFGTSDAYVGTMKGVVHSICPTARIVDITHEIRPQDIRQAAYLLLTAYRFFPPETIFVVIVDPGVGTARAPIAVATPHGTFVAPDNGVLSYALAGLPISAQVTLSNPAFHLNSVSATFHGRDIFSPAAAHLANGTPITHLGPHHDTLCRLPDPVLITTSDGIRGEVLHIDHFGNIITSIGDLAWQNNGVLVLNPRFGLPAAFSCRFDARSAVLVVGDRHFEGIRHTYGEVASGSFTALVGSSGQLELGINQGCAVQSCSVRLGDPVTLHAALEPLNGSQL